MAITAQLNGGFGFEIIQVQVWLAAPHEAEYAGFCAAKAAMHGFAAGLSGQQLGQGEPHRPQPAHAQPLAPSDAFASFDRFHPQRKHLYSPMRCTIVYRTAARRVKRNSAMKI